MKNKLYDFDNSIDQIVIQSHFPSANYLRPSRRKFPLKKLLFFFIIFISLSFWLSKKNKQIQLKKNELSTLSQLHLEHKRKTRKTINKEIFHRKDLQNQLNSVNHEIQAQKKYKNEINRQSEKFILEVTSLQSQIKDKKKRNENLSKKVFSNQVIVQGLKRKRLKLKHQLDEKNLSNIQKEILEKSKLLNLKRLQILEGWTESKLSSLCYSTYLHTFDKKLFHKNCDNKWTVTLIYTSSDDIIGGYTRVSWGEEECKADYRAFIFNLNQEVRFKAAPFIKMITPGREKYPDFGDDLRIGDSLLGYSTFPSHFGERSDTQEMFHKSHKFIIVGFEVFEVEKKLFN